jgi:DNA-binding HxlR family transcriptional regulator
MPVRLILNQAIADGLDVIGDRWTILILRSAFYGVNRFDAFQAATGASRSRTAIQQIVLSTNLRRRV